VEEYLLEKMQYSPARAKIGGQLCAVGGANNFQGNARIAAIHRYSTRTAQRARKDLETDALVRTFLLKPGEQLPEQRVPVRMFVTVRNVVSLRTDALLYWQRKGKGYTYQPPEEPAPREPPPAAPPPPRRATVQAAELRRDPLPVNHEPPAVAPPEPMTAEEYRALEERYAADPFFRGLFADLAKLHARGPPDDRD
jgi:hypothetical protein